MINLYKDLRGFKTVESAGNFGLGPAGGTAEAGVETEP
jgi:hypothetical protein